MRWICALAYQQWQQFARRELALDAAVAYALRARGGRRRPSTGWDSLTPTELQVVDQVVAGRTNTEIAEVLLMGRTTVKTHLGHIFTKLDITNRAELAAQLSGGPRPLRLESSSCGDRLAGAGRPGPAASSTLAARSVLRPMLSDGVRRTLAA